MARAILKDTSSVMPFLTFFSIRLVTSVGNGAEPEDCIDPDSTNLFQSKVHVTMPRDIAKTRTNFQNESSSWYFGSSSQTASQEDQALLAFSQAVCVLGPLLLIVLCTYASSHMSPIHAENLHIESSLVQIEGGPDMLSTKQYQIFERLYFVTIFLICLVETVIIPESANVSRHLGQNPAFSGFLIGAVFPLGIFTFVLFKFQSYHSRKVIIILSAIGFTLSTALCAVAAQPPAFLQMAPPWQANLLLLSRAAMGMFVVGAGAILLVCQKCAPSDHAVTLQLCKGAVIQVGMASGPFLSTLIGDLAGARQANTRMSLVLGVVAIAWGAQTLILIALLPVDLTQVLESKFKETKPITHRSSPQESSQEPSSSEKAIWIAGVVIGILRTFMVASLESATAAIFQFEFGLTTSEIGPIIGASLGLIAIVGPILVKFQRLCHISDETMLTVLWPFLFFGVLLLRMGTTTSAIFVADAIIFSTATMSAAIGDGLAIKNSWPGTWYSQEMYYIYILTLRLSASYAVAPLTARVALQGGGRSLYANFQLLMCICVFFSITPHYSPLSCQHPDAEACQKREKEEARARVDKAK